MTSVGRFPLASWPVDTAEGERETPKWEGTSLRQLPSQKVSPLEDFPLFLFWWQLQMLDSPSFSDPVTVVIRTNREHMYLSSRYIESNKNRGSNFPQLYQKVKEKYFGFKCIYKYIILIYLLSADSFKSILFCHRRKHLPAVALSPWLPHVVSHILP